jgi:hypothetical protein
MFVACHHRDLDPLIPSGNAKLFAYPNKPNYAGDGKITILDSGAFYFYMSKQERPSDYVGKLQAHYSKYGQVANVHCSAPDVALDPLKTMQSYEAWFKLYDTKIFPVLQCKSKRLDLHLLKKQLEFYSNLAHSGVTTEIDFIAMANPGISPLEAKSDLIFLRKLIVAYLPYAWVHILGAGFNARDVQDWHACGFDSTDSISYYTDAQQGVHWIEGSYEKELFDLKETTWTSIALDNLRIANQYD